ncbi:MAG: Jag N-terminal domain-containing protein [Proteobacteria bacterium]|nr:Jag N-terminal domain-containing protein [Pseudomonadota bacterium]
MSSTNEVRIEAKTIEAAVVMACVKLGVTQDNVEYEVVKQPRTGLLALFGGKAEIRAWPRGGRQGAQRGQRGDRSSSQNQNSIRDQNRSAAHDNSRGRVHHDLKEARGQENGGEIRVGQSGNRNGRPKNNDRPNDRNSNRNAGRVNGRSRQGGEERAARDYAPREERAPAEPLAPEMLILLETEIRDFCKELCEKIVGETVKVSSTMTADRLQLEIDNTAIAAMFQEQGKFIESLEHILRKKPRHLKQDLPFRIFIDAQGSRKGREEEIGRAAQEKADQVALSGQKVVLDYRSAADRKVVHMTLENDQRVYTKSIGTGSGRKLMILPSRGRKPAGNSDDQDIGDDSAHT